MGAQFCTDGGAHAAPRNREEQRIKRERQSFASDPEAGRSFANGQQEKVTQLREISDKAKAVMERLPIKHLPFQPERWKEAEGEADIVPRASYWLSALYRVTAGSLAILLAIRNASSSVSTLAMWASRVHRDN